MVVGAPEITGARVRVGEGGRERASLMDSWTLE